MRFFYSPSIARKGEVQPLPPAERAHLFTTLRARPGDRAAVLDGAGNWAETVVKEDLSLEVTAQHHEAPPKTEVHLFCAAPRKKELDLVLKQGVEVNAASLNFIECRRSVATPDGNASERWRAMVIEACKQSHRFYAPEVSCGSSLEAAVLRTAETGLERYYGEVKPRENSAPVNFGARLALFIGPEGGFTPEEEEFMRENAVRPWHFADNVLRMETAAICGVAIMNMLAAQGGGGGR